MFQRIARHYPVSDEDVRQILTDAGVQILDGDQERADLAVELYDSGESEPLMRTTLARLAQRGELHQVVKDLYYPQTTMATLAGVARAVGARHDGVVTAAPFRDATQLGRKRAIQVLEHFDRIGLTRRVGDRRQ